MPNRLARAYRERTPSDFIAWAMSRVVRRQSHVLFHAGVADLEPGAAPPGVRAVEINAENFAEMASIRSKVTALNAQSAAYFDDVRLGKAFGLALVRDGEVVHYAFLFVRNKTARMLGLPAGCALMGNAYTIRSQRGRGLQGYSARCRARIAKNAGFESVASETSPANRASQRGLEKAGMKRVGRVELLVLLNCIVVRHQRPRGLGRLGLCLR